MEAEKWEVWDSVFCFSKALRGELRGLHPRNRRQLYFDFCIMTDGHGASLKFTLPQKSSPADGECELTEWPKRGIWAVDQLKHLHRASHSPHIPCDSSPQSIAEVLDAHIESVQAIGVDPGKLELAVATDPALARLSRKIRTLRPQDVHRLLVWKRHVFL